MVATHGLLLDLLALEVRDRGILRLIQAWLNAEALNDLPPTTHVGNPPLGTVEALPLVVLGAITAVLCLAAVIGFNLHFNTLAKAAIMGLFKR